MQFWPCVRLLLKELMEGEAGEIKNKMAKLERA